uniref:Uncharacterized protein n=1 Tax=Panagrolaimus sp. ES5 TaxID=591445 RepID=A0AC34FIV7_9BILA
MYDYKPVEIHAWKIGYGIGISLATFFIGLILAMVHILIVFLTPKKYLLDANAAKKQSVIAECRPPPTVSQAGGQRKRHRNRPSQLQAQDTNQGRRNEFFYIDTTALPQQQQLQQLPPPTSSANFDEEFLDRLKQDIRYYPKLTMKNNEIRRNAFVPHQHGRIPTCTRKKIPELSIGFELKQQQESDAASENNIIDSFISDASEDDFTKVNDAKKTKTNETIQNTAFARFASKYLEKKDIEDSHREASHIPIKENDSIFKTLKNVKHGF